MDSADPRERVDVCGRELVAEFPWEALTEEYDPDTWYEAEDGTHYCCREVWDGAYTDRCLWHADVVGKPADVLAAARSGKPARLDSAVLRESNLRDGVSLSDCRLPGADLGEANLEDADLGGADLQQADLGGASLRGADLGGAGLWGADLGGADLQDSRLSDATFQKADLLRTAAHRGRQWARTALYGATMRYGESPRRVVGVSVLTVFAFGVVYPYFGGIDAGGEASQHYGFEPVVASVEGLPAPVVDVLANLYFSAVTFTTLGYGDIQPATPVVELLASVESFVGALLMALLVFVLGRRATW